MVAAAAVEVTFEQEVAAVQQAYLGARRVGGERERALGTEDLVVAAPHGQQRDPAVAQVGVQLGVQREVGGVVGEQGQLDQVVAGPGHLGEVVLPGVGADQARIGDAVQVLPLDGVHGQSLADGGLGLGIMVLPVLPHRLPEALHEADLIAVAVLGDDRRDRGRIVQGEPPAHRRAVVLHVHGVPGDAKVAQQARGQPGQRVEGVAELSGRRRVGQAEAQMVRSDHVIPVGQQRDQVAEHERASRESVQQHQGRSAGRARFPVEQLMAVDVGVSVVDGLHI